MPAGHEQVSQRSRSANFRNPGAANRPRGIVIAPITSRRRASGNRQQLQAVVLITASPKHAGPSIDRNCKTRSLQNVRQKENDRQQARMSCLRTETPMRNWMNARAVRLGLREHRPQHKARIIAIAPAQIRTRRLTTSRRSAAGAIWKLPGAACV